MQILCKRTEEAIRSAEARSFGVIRYLVRWFGGLTRGDDANRDR